MKQIALLVLVVSTAAARADLTIVQNVDTGGGKTTQMTMKIKGDQMRVDPAPEMSIISNGQTGETVTLIHNEKKAMRISGEKLKAAADMVKKFASNSPAPEQSKLTATGRKETVNGMQTDVYTAQTPFGKAIYYLATDYPDAPSILAEMKTAQLPALANAATNVPDFRDLPGIPIKIEMDAQGQHAIMTLVAIRRDQIPNSDFTIPADYHDVKMPDLFGGKAGPPTGTATPRMPSMPQSAPKPAPTAP